MKRVSNHRKNIEAKKLGEKRVNPAQNAIQNAKSHYRLIFESAEYGILIIHAATGRIEDANPYLLQLLGYSWKEIVGGKAWQLHVDPETARQRLEKVAKHGADHWHHVAVLTTNGSMVSVEIVYHAYNAGRKKLIQCNIREITELKRTQKSLTNLSHAINASGDVVFMTDKDGIITSINPRFTELYGFTPDEVVNKTTPRILKSGVQVPEFYAQFWKTILQNELVSGEVVNRTKEGKLVFIEETVNPFLDDHGNIAGFLAIQRNVTERKKAEESVRRQLSRLKALREIDFAIASGIAMQLNLSILLKHTIAELGIDAACILLLNPQLNRLEYAAGHGFRTRAIEKSNIGMGNGHAGQAIMRRVTVQVDDLNESQTEFARANLLSQEEFVSYYGVPLIAKGLVKGVLEIFHRTRLESDNEWLDFLQTLAGQAAIAIEDAQLFHSLQQSNIELRQAYDATIEGWSRALDLRDKETEGHTQRVTQMAMMLGQQLGLGDQELQYMRWGGLLHDIGKMAVPDSILLKPDALTPKETELMKQHTIYALQMLSPIQYLKPALDIPYCHHERWDGSGYPRGLKQEEIPLTARIFTIADVFDALTSDRPYRTKWTEADAVEYIREHSGSFFDPKIVNVFLQMMEANQSM
jgi:PAS domain S-box-containing protein/putative nucleotidyltransferase with HDIG domain